MLKYYGLTPCMVAADTYEKLEDPYLVGSSQMDPVTVPAATTQELTAAAKEAFILGIVARALGILKVYSDNTLATEIARYVLFKDVPVIIVLSSSVAYKWAYRCSSETDAAAAFGTAVSKPSTIVGVGNDVWTDYEAKRLASPHMGNDKIPVAIMRI